MLRKKDVNDYKSKVAAEFIMKRCPDVKVTYYKDPIQKYDETFFEQFMVIIAGLDNIEARRWMNAMLHSMVKFDKNGQPEEGT